jgi:hypothetical protein
MHLFSSGSNLEIGLDSGSGESDWMHQQHKVSVKSFPLEFDDLKDVSPTLSCDLTSSGGSGLNNLQHMPENFLFVL